MGKATIFFKNFISEEYLVDSGQLTATENGKKVNSMAARFLLNRENELTTDIQDYRVFLDPFSVTLNPVLR